MIKSKQIFKVKTSIPDFKDIPVSEWTIEQFVRYFEYQHEKLYGFKTSRPRGQIKVVINSKTIRALYKYYGRLDISDAELFRQYLDAMMIKNNSKTFRLRMLSDQNNMTEYLDGRMAEKFGSIDEFRKQEEQKKKEAEEYYRKLGWKPDDEFKF
jgi:hypothetical protein